MIGGAISVGLVFLVERLGTVFQMALSTRGATDGPALGLFVLGMLVPWSNARGAMTGGCVGLVGMFWLAGGAQWHIAHGRIKYDALPTSMDGCPYPASNETVPSEMSATLRIPASTNREEPMMLFRISFMYYMTIGATITVVIGAIASYIFGVDLERVDPDHVTPMMRRYVKGEEATTSTLCLGEKSKERYFSFNHISLINQT